MSNVDFNNPETQQASWKVIHDVILAAVRESVSRAQALYPSEDPTTIAVRDGMVLRQLHMILAWATGDVEGRVLRQTGVTEEDVSSRRNQLLEEGRVGLTVKT